MNKQIFKKILTLLAISAVCAGVFLTRSIETIKPLVEYEGLCSNGDVFLHGINVNQGAASLIKTKDMTVLIDTGEEAEGRKLLNYLKGEKVCKIDYLFITHPHKDHYGAVPVILKEIEVDRVFIPLIPEHLNNVDISWQDMLSTLEKNNVEISVVNEKQDFPLGKGVVLQLLGPFLEDARSLNDLSMCFKLQAGKRSFIITGDGEKKTEEALLKEDIDADVLFAGHHGSKTSSNDFFLERVTPEISFISVGFANTHNLPDRVHIDNLSKYGRVYRSDLDGSVVFVCKRDEISVFTEKERGKSSCRKAL